MRNILTFFLFFLCLFIPGSYVHSFLVEGQTSGSRILKTIVIDPGHGGDDYGAVGPKGTREKDINLGIAKKLKKIIVQNMNATVILTRSDDTFIPLDERTEIANRNKADLFISIHANASYRKGTAGVETYFLSFDASDEDAQRAAAFENAVPSIEGKSGEEDSGDLKTILMDMVQTEYLNESSRLAEIIQENLCRILKGENRGIKQAPFLVLVGAAMPAVLVEVGFLSNANEEKRLTVKKTQEEIAGAIFKSITKFESILTSQVGYVVEEGPGKQ